jgi:hypothetical protein
LANGKGNGRFCGGVRMTVWIWLLVREDKL